jgi:hypothetical protein
MSENDSGPLEQDGIAALAHLEKALALLDKLDLPIEVAAHVDLAIHRLRATLQQEAGTSAPTGKPPPSG